jgi:hypothetical protein
MEVWATEEVALAGVLRDWKKMARCHAHQAKGWQVLAYEANPCLDEDVPHDVAQLLPGVAYRYGLVLEPIGAPAAGKKLLVGAANAIAKAAHGAVVDPQTDEVWLPSGLKRYRTTQKEETVAVVNFAWWHWGRPSRARVGELLTVLERTLPEALPRRYGDHEPPPHEYAKTGRKHFLDTLAKGHVAVWYPNRPVVSAHACWDARQGWINEHLGFRAQLFEVGVLASALAQPGWARQLARFWRAASAVLQPFFGSVRTLRGYQMNANGRLWHGSRTEEEPTRSWWWRGIPASLGHAVVLGEPYLSRWPKFARHAERKDGLAFASTADFTERTDLTSIVGAVPKKLAQHTDAYPPDFPFPKK